MQSVGGSLRSAMMWYVKFVAAVAVAPATALWALSARGALVAFLCALPLPLICIGLTEWALRGDVSAARVVTVMLGRKVATLVGLALAAAGGVSGVAGALLAVAMEPVAYLVAGLRTGNRP